MDEPSFWESPLTKQRFVLCKYIEMSSHRYISDPETIHLILHHSGYNHRDTVKWMLETGIKAGRIQECTNENELEDIQ